MKKPPGHKSQQQSSFTPALEAENARLRETLINAARHLHAAAIWFGSHGPGHAAEQEEYMQYHNEAARALIPRK